MVKGEGNTGHIHLDQKMHTQTQCGNKGGEGGAGTLEAWAQVCSNCNKNDELDCRGSVRLHGARNAT